MPTKSYGEQAAAVLFTAGREMRRVAMRVLEDSVNDVELVSVETHTWVKQKAASYAERANNLEAEACDALGQEAVGHLVLALGFYDMPAATKLSHSEYSKTISSYERRRQRALDRKARSEHPLAAGAL